jgi:penicillin-binding protein 1A
MKLLWRILKTLFSSVFLAIVTLVGAPVAFGATILAGLIFIPLPATIPIPKPNPTLEPTIIYDRYGHQIAALQQFDRNLPVTEKQIPQVLKEAVVADEDRNYYHHGGVDLRGTVRALWEDLRNRAPVQGGSTITQQYVKLAYTNAQRTVVRKVREAILASQLAREASKDEILYRYLTLVYFGDGNYGVGAASETYFGVSVERLNPSQAATLAGLIPAPSARAPEQHLAGAEAARELVLKKMYQQGYLTAAQYKKWLAARLALVGSGPVPKGATVILPEEVPNNQYPDFVNYVVSWLKQHNYSDKQLYTGGLRIQTTLDPAVQQAAAFAVNTTLSGSAPPIDMALASVQPQTGFVEALIGGRGFGGKGPGQQDNLALGGCQGPSKTAQVVTTASCWSQPMISGCDGCGGRQPGSSWKPFTLATAFEQGIPPSTIYSAPPVYQIPNCVVPPGKPATYCQIHNDEGDGYIGSTNLAFATWQSINTVYSQVASQVGCGNVANTAKKVGIESAYYSTPPFYYCESYALGELGVSPLDMASAYGVFASHGQRAAPTPILEVVNSQGKVLLNNIKPLPKTTQVIPTNVADNVTDVLQGVIASGTGTAAQLGRPAAGKTGTTSNNTDAWFVGYTPTLSTAVWMGNYNSESSMGPVTGCLEHSYCYTVGQVYGGTWPAITWKEFMSAALQNVPATPFNAPAPIVPPTVAAPLRQAQHQTTTTVGILPGAPGAVEGTPAGGPYQYPPPTPLAPPPPTTVPPPATTTTLPKQTTTTSSSTTTTVPAATSTTGFGFGF